MQSTLLYIVHADPSVRASYQAACPDGVDVVPLVTPGGGLSSAYDRLAAECRAAGANSAVVGLSRRFPPPKRFGDYEHVFLATYSAGYGFARGMTETDRKLLDGVIFLDSVHAAQDADGSASDAGIAWLVQWAKEAREGRKLCWLGHSDVDPVSYASTTEVALEAVRLAGPPGRLFHVEAFNVAANPKEEHGKALTLWGPRFVGRALRLFEADASPGIIDAFSDAGRLLVHAAASLPKLLALEPEAPPHGYRAAVSELVADARTSGSWRDRSTGYRPQPGDLAIFKRAGGDPRFGGSGHVSRVAVVGPAVFETIGGNEANRVRYASCRFDDPSLVGWIVYPERLAAAALEVARDEIGVSEKPGPAHDDRVLEYLAGCVRNGQRLALAADEFAWCAAFASWCAARAAG